MIAYHFGGKEGLRAACADTSPSACAAFRRRPRSRDPEAARARWPPAPRLHPRVVADEAARPLARFLLREISDPSAASPASTRPPSRRCTPRLPPVGAASGADAESAETRLAVFAMIGRRSISASPAPPCCCAWAGRDIGPDEAAAIEAIILGN